MVDSVLFAHTLGQRQVLEAQAFDVTLTFCDGEAKTAPSGDVHYRISNPQTGTVVRDWTAIIAPTSVEQITITGNDNVFTDAEDTEYRELLVRDATHTVLGRMTWQIWNVTGR